MAETTNLKVTLIEQSQAQKEVTINEGFSLIDSILNNGAKDKDLATPPGSPAEGDVYIVAGSPTGAWSGKAGQIAFFNQIWRFIIHKEGMSLWVNDEDVIYTYNGSLWGSITLGVNAQTGTTYTVTSTDNGKVITLSNSSPTTLTVPQTSTESLSRGFNISIVQLGTGEVTIAKQGSDNLYSEGNKLKLNAQYARAAIVKIVEGSPNTWSLSGSLKV